MRRLLLTLPALLTLSLAAQAGDKGTVVKLDKYTSTTPATWKKETPSKFRVYQFDVPKAKGDPRDAEIAIFFFEGGGGSAEENIERQKKKFIQPEGQKVRSKTENFKVGTINMTYFDISGTYLDKFPPFDPKAKEEKRADYRMIYVYFGSENGPYFIRFVGPANTVEANKKAFDEWLKNFK